jgi:hypothetical protein
MAIGCQDVPLSGVDQKWSADGLNDTIDNAIAMLGFKHLMARLEWNPYALFPRFLIQSRREGC